MLAPPITVHVLVNQCKYTSALIDSGCLSYALITRSFVRRAELERIPIPRKPIVGVNDQVSWVDEVAKFTFDMNGYTETGFAYVTPNDAEEDIILGRPWMNRNQVTIAPAKKSIYLHALGIRIRSQEGRAHPLEIREVCATEFRRLMNIARRKKNQQEAVQIFAASLADINKALAPKPKVDVLSLVPERWRKHLALFDPKEASRLPPHRPGIDHALELEEKDGKKPEAP